MALTRVPPVPARSTTQAKTRRATDSNRERLEAKAKPGPVQTQSGEAQGETPRSVSLSDVVGSSTSRSGPKWSPGPAQQCDAAVQMAKGSKGSEEASRIHAAARMGVQGRSQPLPFLSTVQSSFGRHDVSHIKAHTDSSAMQAAKTMGAEAFAHGEHVAFGGTPTLHTAAHEAAHVLQQQGGVQLQEKVGRVGDRWEQHADAVADRVVRGQSAEDILDSVLPHKDSIGSSGSAASAPVQHKILCKESEVTFAQAVQWANQHGRGFILSHENTGLIKRILSSSETEGDFTNTAEVVDYLHECLAELSTRNARKNEESQQASSQKSSSKSKPSVQSSKPPQSSLSRPSKQSVKPSKVSSQISKPSQVSSVTVKRKSEMRGSAYSNLTNEQKALSHKMEFDARASVQFGADDYLYHSAPTSVLGSIQGSGITTPYFRSKAYWDHSKDAFISAAIDESGAGSLDSKASMLRFKPGDHEGLWKSYSETEVRTMTNIPAGILFVRIKPGNTDDCWQPLSQWKGK